MKVLTGRSECLGKGALNRKAKRRRGLPVVTGLVACALGVAVAAVVATGAPTALADEAIAGAAGTQTESAEVIGAGGAMGVAVADDPAALPPATAAAEEAVEPIEGQATGEGEGTGVRSAV